MRVMVLVKATDHSEKGFHPTAWRLCPALLHRDHVLHELVDSDLGALVKARLFVCL
jgi:hypothetical protein